MRKLILIAIVVPATIVFFAGDVLALDMEYYTYNGFDSIVGAFQKVALIFGDNGYKALFFSVIALGFLFGALGMVMKAIGGRYSPAAWAAPIGIGIIIYLALIIPKGTLHIYDPIKNRTQAVGNLPDGVIAVAGLLNLVERGLVDIVSTSGTPEGYQAQAGGVGFDMIFNLGSKGVVLADKNINASLQRYTEDCLLFEFLRPGTALTINGAMNNTDFVSIYEEAAAPAIYTVYYSAGGDNTATCQEAWANIKADISNINTFGDSIKSQCADSGFDPTNPLELQQCRDTLTNLLNWLQGASYDTLQVYQQTLLAQSLNDALLSVSPDTATTIIASRNTGTAMLSSGMFANSWIPAIRAVITAIAIGLIPFMVIFIPTPLVNRAVGILVGFFIWITAWGVTDAVVHQFAMDYAKKAFDEVTRNQLGLTAIMNFSTAGMKTLAAFASIRWSGIMLATVITGMLVRFGGHALAQLSGQITSLPQHQAQSAGMSAMTPEGMSRSLGAAEMAPSAMANAHKFSFMDRSAAHTMDRMAKTQYGRDMANNFGGVGGASEMIATGSAGFTVSKAASGAAMKESPGGLSGALNTMKFDQGSHLAYTRMVSDAFDGNYTQHGAMKGSSLLGSIEGAGGVDNYIKNLHNTGQAEQMGLTRAANERSTVTGETYDQAFRNNIVDKVVFDSMKTTAVGQALGRMGYGSAVKATANNEMNSMQQGQAREELANRLGISINELQKREADVTARQDYFNKTALDELAMELGRGNREAGYGMLAEYGLTNVRSDNAAFGSPEGTVAAQTVQKAVGHGNALGLQQAGSEIGMDARTFAKATSHLDAQQKVGVLEAMRAGHLREEDLRSTGFVKAVQGYFNAPQMMASARAGDTTLTHSLYGPDGKMDERMRQAWAEGNTRAFMSMIEHYGKENAGLGVQGALGKAGAALGVSLGTDKITNHNLTKARFLELSERAQDLSPNDGSRYLANKTQAMFGEVGEKLRNSWNWNKPIETRIKELPETYKGPTVIMEGGIFTKEGKKLY
ncbi:MAG TPA: hypothetical protein DDZ40_04485 [Deltaproteobacteria bacterium]|nr:hypothetical protein [Deltaproteobacteria bacterium]